MKTKISYLSQTIKKGGFLFLLFFLSTCYVQGQNDDLFWFAAPDVSEYSTYNLLDRPIKLNIASFSNSTTNVSISQPANAAFTAINITIPANGFYTIDLTPWMTMIENNMINTVLPYGILIQANNLVNVNYEVGIGKNSPEIYSLKGQNALGTDFLIPGQSEYANFSSGTPPPRNQFDIVATEDSTVVTVIPAQDLAGGFAANNPFSFTLQRGETYCCKANGYLAANHLQGSVVTATKPIAITLTDDNLNHPGNGQDLIGDQIIPTNVLGKEYIAVKGTLTRDADKTYVLGTINNTSIYIGGSITPNAIINRGETFIVDYPAGDNAVYFRTDHPVYAFQLTGVNIEFGAAILPPIQCTGSDHVKYKRASAGSDILRLNITVENGGDSTFLFNNTTGFISSADFSPVPGTNGDWLYASKEVPVSILPLGQLLSVSNTNTNFHLGVFEGGLTTGCSYGFYSGFSDPFILRATINETGRVHTFCEGDTLCLALADTSLLFDFQWKGNNGFIANTHDTTLAPLTTAHSGVYRVSASAITNCTVSDDSVIVVVYPNPTIDLGDEIKTCRSSIVLNAQKSGCNYLWSNGDDYHEIIVLESNKYWVELEQNGCFGSDTVTVILVPTPTISIEQEGLLCKDQIVVLKASNDMGSLQWSTGERTKSIIISEAGEYWVEATYDICSNKTSLYVHDVKIDSLAISKEGNICKEETIQLTATSDGEQFLWSTGDNTSTIDVNSFDIFYVSVTNGYCTLMDSIEIEFCCPELEIPNIITPSDQNDINDYFFFPTTIKLQHFDIYIYNRWGKLVFKSSSPEFKWDGNVGGNVETGVYYYNIDLGKGCTYHGTITVL